MLPQDQIIAVLAGHRTFAGIDPKAWGTFIDAGAVVALSPDEVVYDKGQTHSAGYVLVSGRLEIVDEPYPGRRLCTQLFSAGSLFAEGGFIKHWEHRRRCTAIESSVALAVESHAFNDLVESGNVVALRIIDRLLDEFVLDVREANQRLDEVYARPDRTLRRLQALQAG